MKLFPHQLEAIEILKNKRRFLLSDEQGLGKSAVSIHVALLRNAKRVLILCPKSLILNWVKEINLWCDECLVFTPYTTRIDPSPFLLTFAVYNWDSLVVEKRVKDLLSIDWDLVIGDESHKAIKNWKARRCKTFIFELVPKAKSVLLMTGTPITKSAMDLHPTLSVLAPGRWGKFSDFCEAFCQKSWSGFGSRGFEYFGFKNEEELRTRMAPLMLRRLKKDVLQDLPDKRYKVVPVSVDLDAIGDILDLDLEVLNRCIEQGIQPPSHISTFIRAVGQSKVDSAIEYLTNLGVPTVVFASHKEVITSLERGLVNEGLHVGLIQGETSTQRRQEVVDLFQAGELDIVIGNLIAASTGITLTISSNVVFLEYPWTPDVFLQACDRVHRIGQKNSVLIHCLVAEDTFDDVVVNSLILKSSGIDRVMGSQEHLEEVLTN